MSSFKRVGDVSFDGKRYILVKWESNAFDGDYEFMRVKDA